MKGWRKKGEKEGKTYTDTTRSRPLPSYRRRAYQHAREGGFGEVLDQGPELRAALCLSVLRRNFPSLTDGETDKMCNL